MDILNKGYAPIGTIISVMGSCPENFLVCNNTDYQISVYSDLANYFQTNFGKKNYFGGNGTTTFRCPDLRGEFLRGTGTNGHANQGSGSNTGVHQDATEHLSAFFDAYSICAPRSGGIPANTDNYMGGNARGYVGILGSDTAGIIYRSRPTNTSVLYCISYRKID